MKIVESLEIKIILERESFNIREKQKRENLVDRTLTIGKWKGRGSKVMRPEVNILGEAQLLRDKEVIEKGGYLGGLVNKEEDNKWLKLSFLKKQKKFTKSDKPMLSLKQNKTKNNRQTNKTTIY